MEVKNEQMTIGGIILFLEIKFPGLKEELQDYHLKKQNIKGFFDDMESIFNITLESQLGLKKSADTKFKVMENENEQRETDG